MSSVTGGAMPSPDLAPRSTMAPRRRVVLVQRRPDVIADSRRSFTLDATRASGSHRCGTDPDRAVVAAFATKVRRACHDIRVMREAARITILVTGCPDSGSDKLSPRTACEGMSAALCERIYACLTPEELASGGFPPNEAACVQSLENDQACSAQTPANACDGDATFHGDRAATCVDQIEGLSCAQLRSPDTDLDTAAPACDTVCAVD
jgi:hypothetical protein